VFPGQPESAAGLLLRARPAARPQARRAGCRSSSRRRPPVRPWGRNCCTQGKNGENGDTLPGSTHSVCRVHLGLGC
jgi:hypothetical protein